MHVAWQALPSPSIPDFPGLLLPLHLLIANNQRLEVDPRDKAMIQTSLFV